MYNSSRSDRSYNPYANQSWTETICKQSMAHNDIYKTLRKKSDYLFWRRWHHVLFSFFLSEYFYIRISKMPKLEYPKELEVALMYFLT